MKKRFEKTLRSIFAIANILSAVLAILLISSAAFLISDSVVITRVIQQQDLNGYEASSVLFVVSGICLFVVSAVGLFSSVKSKYFIISLVLYITSFVVIGLLIVSAIPLTFVYYSRMNSYLTYQFPTNFNVTNNSPNNIGVLESQLSCCGVSGVDDYATLSVPHSCRCVKQKAECTNTTTSYYKGGCSDRLRQTNQIHAYMGGVAAVILCFQMGLLVLAPVIIYLNYK